MLTIALPTDVPMAVVNEKREEAIFAPQKESRDFSAGSSGYTLIDCYTLNAVIHLYAHVSSAIYFHNAKIFHTFDFGGPEF